MSPDPDLLIQLTVTPMPFGKYKGTLLCDLPVSYLEWFEQKGFPEGKLGIELQTIYEIKLNLFLSSNYKPSQFDKEN